MQLVLALAPLVGAVLALVGYAALPFVYRKIVARMKAEIAGQVSAVTKAIAAEGDNAERGAESLKDALSVNHADLLAALDGLDIAAVRAEIVKLSAELQSAIGGVQSSLAALDLPGVKQSVAALRIATGSAVADLHTAIAESRAQPLSADAKALHDKIEALHDEVKDQKQASLVTDASRAHAIVFEAVADQKAHEKGHPVEYQSDQREQSVFLKAQHAYRKHRLAAPANLLDMVRDALRD